MLIEPFAYQRNQKRTNPFDAFVHEPGTIPQIDGNQECRPPGSNKRHPDLQSELSITNPLGHEIRTNRNNAMFSKF